MEHTYFQQGGVTVTNSRFIVGNQTYAMRNITSVKPITNYPSRNGPILAILVGLAATLIGFGIPSIGSVLFGLLLCGLGVFWWTRQRPTYSIFLATSGGEVRALEHGDWSFIENINGALNQSITTH